MRVLNAVQRVIMLLLLVPVIAIGLDTLLRAFNAQQRNPIVDAVREAADTFIVDTFRTVFPDQSYLQTALVALAGYGVLTLLVVLLFRLLRSLATAKPPRSSVRESSAPPRTSPAEPTEKTEKSEKTEVKTETTEAGQPKST